MAGLTAEECNQHKGQVLAHRPVLINVTASWVDNYGPEVMYCLSKILPGSRTRQPSLDSMPEDILHLIFGAAQLHTAAGTKDRCRLSGVCRRWRRMLGRPEYWQEIELSTGDFRASSAFAEGLLACAAHAGNWLQSIRVVQTLPGRQCSPKVVYGDKGTRLEMYRGAQVGFCAESKELETWLMHCHERLKRERCLPTRHNAAWLHEFDRIEQVMSGKRFRVQPPRVQPEILNVVLKVGQWVAASGTAVLMIAGCTLWARLILGCVIWPSLLVAAFVASTI
ncbi:hypothetical protein CVIRNUC_004665 [Coccomyxa viridis]|uniref:F-box domain-containing protein n=1 Tax=Coccomyxa viridis TaxID=1274662 RepID=A0AAV1I5Y7_9CHLO|nr:hypothetical protein CVIRNUC_004665 [Coccomyxa viridis]